MGSVEQRLLPARQPHATMLRGARRHLQPHRGWAGAESFIFFLNSSLFLPCLRFLGSFWNHVIISKSWPYNPPPLKSSPPSPALHPLPSPWPTLSLFHQPHHLGGSWTTWPTALPHGPNSLPLPLQLQHQWPLFSDQNRGFKVCRWPGVWRCYHCPQSNLY